jgi:DNA-directed RNA polymerase beta' subunit
LYAKIIANNNAISSDLPRMILISKVNALNASIKTLFNSKSSSLRGFKQRISGKSGLMRRNIMGGRVNFTGRSVITCDPSLEVTEIGVPEHFARVLTTPRTGFVVLALPSGGKR